MKVALIQQAFEKDKATTRAKTRALIVKAARNGAVLVCLNELHENAYFCQSEDVALFDLAEDYAKDIEFWGQVAKENGVVLVSSLFEKRAAGLYHNTAVIFEKDGRVAGKYRKMHIPDCILRRGIWALSLSIRAWGDLACLCAGTSGFQKPRG